MLLTTVYTLDYDRLEHWFINGGEKTIESFKRVTGLSTVDFFDLEKNKFLIDFLSSFPTLIVSNKTIFTHAAYNPDLPPEKQEEYFLIWNRENFWDRNKTGKAIYFGHTPSKKENETYNADIDTVVDLALAQVGKPYVWATANPNIGFDCSGLTYYVYKQVGINLSRTSYTQINYGTRVSASELRKGDLVFFNNGGGRISHVGIYIGNNKFVHASTPGTGVIVSKLFGSYFGKTFVGATRLIK